MLLSSIAAIVGFTAVSAERLAPLLFASEPSLEIPNEYLVQLKAPDMAVSSDGAYPGLVQAHLDALFGESLIQSNNIIHRYNLGYAAVLDEQTLAKVRHMPDVDFIEANQVYKISDEQYDRQASPDNWGLKRVSQRDLPMKDEYVFYKSAGEGVNVYVVDNGVLVNHTDFENRAELGVVVPRGEKEADGNHGTHVASTIAGKLYGVAKKATIINVKVLRSSGYGSTADVLAGIEFVASDHNKRVRANKLIKSVANMSLGGGKSTMLDNAVNSAIKQGVLFAVAAGNDNRDACRYSPAGAEDALTVGATDRYDARAYFSNYGKCVDIFAPGHEITAAWNDDVNSTITISGTSMASPHVCGVMALLIAEQDYTPAELKKRVLELSTPNKVKRAGWGSPNKLLFNGVDASRHLADKESAAVAQKVMMKSEIDAEIIKSVRFQL
ncbi:hypothetical protein MP228_008146 [Amoeboaphelidium protococcarum]|nr:hypothetical protein MP228_008146 [Amoeboaphelidium protococcarum]